MGTPAGLAQRTQPVSIAAALKPFEQLFAFQALCKFRCRKALLKGVWLSAGSSGTPSRRRCRPLPCYSLAGAVLGGGGSRSRIQTNVVGQVPAGGSS